MTAIFFLAWAALARAESPAPVFAQDPLCAESPSYFSDVLAKARATHLGYPALQSVNDAQTKWFRAVTGEMKSICDADAKLALEIRSKTHPEATGQCKPAAEAALTDQEVLAHSEASLRALRGKREEYLLKGQKGGPESLWAIFTRDYQKVENDALELGDLPRVAACELGWMYPKAFLEKKPPFTGCPEAPPGVKISHSDRKDAGIFARLMTRYGQSVEYNTQRRNNAKATADASRARYEACIAKEPGAENVLVKAAGTHGKGSAAKAGKKPAKGSDITGVEEDKSKREK
jgi:hypothetical protein